MSLTAAIDLGTTTIRVGLFDSTGQRVAVAHDVLGLSVPFAGAVEQDPDEFVGASLRLLSQALGWGSWEPTDIGSIGITNQRATVVAWDATTGRALRPAVGWQDTRTADAVAEYRANGIPLNTSASCSKMAWLVQHDAGVAAAAKAGTLRFGTPDSWLTWALSGGAAHITDPSNAGATGLFDLRTGDWSVPALELFGIDRTWLADVVASDAMVGHAGTDMVRAEIPLTGRLGDQMAACAAHDLTVGQAKLTLGTSGMLDIHVGTVPVDAPEGCYTLPLWSRSAADGSRVQDYIVEGSINTAGSVIEWLVRVGLLDRVEALDGVAAQGRPGLHFTPALAGLGSPTNDPAARGALTGIGLDTTPADIVRAAVDGIAERAIELVDHMGVTGDLIVDGGLSRSDVLMALLSERFEAGQVVRAEEPETTLAGAAEIARIR